MAQHLQCPWYIFALLCCVTNIICYVDRINITMAALVLQKQYNWSEHTKGYILGAFFIGYFCTQILGGVLSSKYTGRVVAAYALFIWSIFTLLTPLVADKIWLLIICRIGMGLGEGMELPALHDVISRTIPKTQLARSVAFITSGQTIGILVALGCGPLVKRNWEALFYLFGFLGIFWGLLLLWVTPIAVANPSKVVYQEIELESPTTVDDRTTGDDKEDDEEQNAATESPKGHPQRSLEGKLEWRAIFTMLKHAPSWAVFAAHFGNNWLWYFLISWLPSYLKEALNIPLEKQHSYEFMMYCGAFLGSNTGGFVADQLIKRAGLQRGVVRRISTTISLMGGGAGFLIIALMQSSNPLQNSLVLTVCLFCMKFCDSGFLTNILDIAPGDAALLLGVSNTIATIPGIIANPLSGWLLDLTGSWFPIFVSATGVTTLMWLVFMCLASGKEIKHR
eukprot:TRINITY_DN30297_c0_g1_i1.p1 TRINITY_DN30297_c0_g1~~TRINITY_DN30297_c0_g1_i1.p1  ORF type:complete len:451 (-),score=51.29 TRINITY_DN30297_c0_g1_i1:47-1399(-)